MARNQEVAWPGLLAGESGEESASRLLAGFSSVRL